MLDLDLEKELNDDDADLSDDELLIGNSEDEGESDDEDADVELNDEDEDDLLETEAKNELAKEEPKDKANVQLDTKYSEIPASMVGSDAIGSYSRSTPHQYTQERDDRLMNSLINNYAREIVQDGKQTGQMFLNKEDAEKVSNEVLRTHKQNNA